MREQPDNDNEPRSDYEIAVDQSYWTLQQAFPNIERDSGVLAASLSELTIDIANYDFGMLDAPVMLSLLSDYELVLQPLTLEIATQLQVSAQILLDDIITEHGLETATQCAIEAFGAAYELRRLRTLAGESNAKHAVGAGLLNILEQAFSDDRFSNLSIKNSAHYLASYLGKPKSETDPSWRHRLMALAVTGMPKAEPEMTRGASVIDLATARRSLKTPKP